MRADLCTAGFAFAHGKCLSHSNPILGLSGFFSIGAALLPFCNLALCPYMYGLPGWPSHLCLQDGTAVETPAICLTSLCLQQGWFCGLLSFVLLHAHCCCENKGVCVEPSADQQKIILALVKAQAQMLHYRAGTEAITSETIDTSDAVYWATWLFSWVFAGSSCAAKSCLLNITSAIGK